jgi:hypothetical protein
MDDIVLTPVERGILLILMAQSGPVRQSDFAGVHGLAIRRQHRLKLRELGLIEVREGPLTLALTKKGWAWLDAGLSAREPAGSKRLRPLHAALGAIGRLTKRLGLPLEEALAQDAPAPSPARAAAPPDADIRQPEWVEVDEVLARALQDISVFSSALSRLREAAKGALEREIKRTDMAANLVFQQVKLAARKRGLDLDGAAGAETSYDPVFFYSDEDIKLGAPVRIRKSPVTRGQGKAKIVIQPGIAEAIHS